MSYPFGCVFDSDEGTYIYNRITEDEDLTKIHLRMLNVYSNVSNWISTICNIMCKFCRFFHVCFLVGKSVQIRGICSALQEEQCYLKFNFSDSSIFTRDDCDKLKVFLQDATRIPYIPQDGQDHLRYNDLLPSTQSRETLCFNPRLGMGCFALDHRPDHEMVLFSNNSFIPQMYTADEPINEYTIQTYYSIIDKLAMLHPSCVLGN